MQKNNPKISVIMPNYNCEKYISEAIESILKQSFTDFEFIIIDDGSTDNSWNIIQEYAKKDDRIVALRNKKNLKICKTLNKWLEIARWEYIARMDSDDISFPKRLEKQIKYLENNKNIWLVWTNCVFINENWIKWNVKTFPEKNIKRYIWYRNPILHPSVVFRRELYEKFWWYDEDFLYAEDLELWIRFWQQSEFYNLQEFLLKYRIFWWNSTLKKQKLMIKNTLKARKKALKLWYKIWVKWIIFYIGTWFMQFIPAKIVLWLFNKINK